MVTGVSLGLRGLPGMQNGVVCSFALGRKS